MNITEQNYLLNIDGQSGIKAVANQSIDWYLLILLTALRVRTS